jgi:diguanylate cyclase (GGDEF)-like protein/PAS domain S-box-containing protein
MRQAGVFGRRNAEKGDKAPKPATECKSDWRTFVPSQARAPHAVQQWENCPILKGVRVNDEALPQPSQDSYFRALFERSQDAILLISGKQIADANPAALRLFHCTDKAGMLGQTLAGFSPAQQPSGEVSVLADAALAQDAFREGGRRYEWLFQLADGSHFWADVLLTSVSLDHEYLSYAVIRDISRRKDEEAQTRHLAEHDFLTDLPNRVLFIDRLQQALAAARRKHAKVALLFIDLDRFKAINDVYGHPVGDLVLKEVALRLARCVRSVDTVSRQGGDEFVVILADIGGEDHAAHVASSVMQAISQIRQVGSVEVSIGSSIGISIFPDDADDTDTLLNHADLAMYHAKQGGRNQFQFFSPAMNAHVIERIELENRLRQALANREFELAYLPEISMPTGQVALAEALLRWRHPQRGLLLPIDFMPAAEGSGLIVPIGEWVLQQACMQARRWHDQGLPVGVSVNLSATQFVHANLLPAIDQALHASGLAGDYLYIEVSEAVLMSGNPVVTATMAGLRARGVHLTVDDFGTGYSNLGTLRGAALSSLKIDPSFVGEITTGARDGDMIPAIIALAHSLKLKVVAEGVETAQQFDYLLRHGCDGYQGRFNRMALNH